ncbi:FAD-binding and (Fe-S)-binding domain-containing protein [Streptomyces sp. NPDC006602]|uniref:FAD-binding and (Fe-S)-binding domain-containing protein n=1 Tax=Streptomyces sp. NPDC006602 TaxID=3364751 RepID=UPI00367EA0B1
MRPLDRLRAHGWRGGGASDSLLDRVAQANDASHYLLTPQAVVVAGSTQDVTELMTAAGRADVALTFRAGGTSLSGQAVTDSVLVDTRRGFRGVEVLDDGRAVRVEPGATVGAVNAALRPYGTKLGPDPASESACTIGGIVANNSSGMTCGTHANPYRTLRSLRFVMPSGTLVDTGDTDADARLRALEPDLYRGLLLLRDQVRENPALVARIRELFAIKNTMGYAVNAFLDFDAAADILAHLIVGSEGTLAFIASATFMTVPVLPHTGTGLLVLPDLVSAASVLPALIDSGAATIELLDAQSLRVAAADKDATERLRALPISRQAALLVEYQAPSVPHLQSLLQEAEARFEWTSGGGDELTTDPATRAALWKIRKGLFAAVAGARAAGTTALLEDIAVPPSVLADTCAELTGLFGKHGYDDSVIFGHAKDGNIHFLLSAEFHDSAGVDRYAAFTEDMVDLVLGRGGTLKAEHGTGRVMAAYVQRQYGAELYNVMRRIKSLCDPRRILNPGVLLTDDPAIHLRHLKTTSPIEAEADRCVECGFCEPVCPSKDLTLTPRQRIVTRRAIAAARQAGDDATATELSRAYEYSGVQTCAADGMCQTACPVDIDTGSLVRRLRAEGRGKTAQAIGRTAARHWAGATKAAAAGLTVAHRLPTVSAAATGAARKVLPAEAVPQWSRELPRGGRARSGSPTPLPDIVFLPSCTGSMFGSVGGVSTADAFLSLCAKAGIRVAVPDEVAGLCCGMPWSSKGLTDGAEVMSRRLHAALRQAGDEGAVPVVVDASSCTEGVRKTLPSGMRVEDATEFTARAILPRVDIERTLDVLALHPTCSSVRMHTDDSLKIIADALSAHVFIPPSWGCCAFAGDRGLLRPELTDSATRRQAAEVRESGATLHVSCNRACELGMTRAVGRPYRHILQVLNERSTRRSASASIPPTPST